MDIAQFNEAIIPYCKALGLTGATVATVVTQSVAPTMTPTQSSTPTPIASVSPSSGFGGLLQQVVNPPLISSRTDEEVQSVVTNGNLLSGNWNYMPGVTADDSGLLIHPTNLSIVEQDGSFAQGNAPINLAGSYLSGISGDFQIEATINLQNANEAVLHLYGESPIIADEFRIERKSVKLTIQNDALDIDMWDGEEQEPFISRSFSFPNTSTVSLIFTRKGSNFVFSVNGREIGMLSDPGIFLSKNLWFGFDGTGDFLLTTFSAKSLNGSLTITDGSKVLVTEHNTNGLQALASKKRSDFQVGAAMALGPLTTDSQYAKVALDNHVMGSMTPENDMKMVNLQPQKGVYTFEKADALVMLAKQNGIQMHGHALVFGEANPTWVNQLSGSEVEDVMKDHITKVVGHFGTDVSEWDVINEPIAEYEDFNASRGRTYRRHVWYQAMGPEYMIKALESAHSANPNAMLFVNEWGLEEDGERWNAFLSMMQKLKTQLQEKQIPVSKIGVGFQAHVYESGDTINPTVLKKHIRQLGALGFKSRISEMDVYNDDGDSIQSKQFADVFNACFSETDCIGWTTWMLSDRYDVFIDDDGSIQYGEDGLFGSDMKPRPGYISIQQILQR